MHKSTIKRAKAIQKLVEQHYEPGRQDRSKMWIWRNIVSKSENPVSATTFFRYLKIDEKPKEQECERQTKLFDLKNKKKACKCASLFLVLSKNFKQ